jgi:hypothetical protein
MKTAPTRALALSALLLSCSSHSVEKSQTSNILVGSPNWLMFHGDRARLGWNADEPLLTPATVAGPQFGVLWQSAQLDHVNIGGTDFPPYFYASPLYVDVLPITAGPYAGATFSAAIVATGNGYVYAINTAKQLGPGGTPVLPGTILWRTFIGPPSRLTQDGGVPIGVMGTPAIDLHATPPTLYLAADVNDNPRDWEVFGLDLTSGSKRTGWPLRLNTTTLSPVNRNGPATFGSAGVMSQRGGLNLSPDGGTLYIPFGSYIDGGTGWLVAVDTGVVSHQTPSVANSFSSAHSATGPQGGLWASGGVSVDESGNVFVVSGNSSMGQIAGTWGESILRWAPGLPLTLNGTYTPWNHCQMDQADIDLCGSGVILIPPLAAGSASVTQLMASGGKQGNAYLMDRQHMPGALDMRPPCNMSAPDVAPVDGSLWNQATTYAYYGGHAGPINIFKPYSETLDMSNQAKARSTPAYFRGSDGTNYVYYTGITCTTGDCTTITPPGLVRMKIVTPGPTSAPYFVVDAQDNQLHFMSPGTPVISSDGSENAIVWIVEPNVRRLSSLIPPPHPQLYAVDATTMRVLYTSPATQLVGGGKYYHPVVARGQVLVATDRLTAFGVASSAQLTTIADAHVRGGTFANTNFGTATQINVKTNSDPSYTREAYFKFDLSSLTSVSSAKLRVFGKTDDGTPVMFGAFAVNDSTWGETTITFNQRPPLGGSISATIQAASTTEVWYELDVTSYIVAEQAAHHGLTTIGLRAIDNNGTRIDLRAREAGANPAQLIIAP